MLGLLSPKGMFPGFPTSITYGFLFRSFIYSCSHSTNVYFCAYCKPGTVLGTRDSPWIDADMLTS